MISYHPKTMKPRLTNLGRITLAGSILFYTTFIISSLIGCTPSNYKPWKGQETTTQAQWHPETREEMIQLIGQTTMDAFSQWLDQAMRQVAPGEDTLKDRLEKEKPWL